MLFPSATFLWLFLPVVLLAHTLIVGRSVRAANVFLLAASVAFYGIGNGVLVLLLFVSVIIDYLAADIARLGRSMGRPTMVIAGVAFSVAGNVGLLGWFKYSGFLAQAINDVAERFTDGSLTVPQVALPVGISFFTFQSMSYTFDVAKGRIQPFRNPLNLLLYVSLFPQLIAGPIVRARDIQTEISSRGVDLDALTDGFGRFVWGLAKKMIIADSVAPLVEAGFAAEPTTASAWIAASAYAVQIYFDFSGYSDMAIGLGRMLGFTFPENFRRPYAAASVTDFWRRWHITLSTWFRDYLYIPMGGNRGGRVRTGRNLIIVFLITGIWHGGQWTFVFWGLMHGGALLVERALNIGRQPANGWLSGIALRVWTALVVLMGWILFNAASLADAGELYRALVIPTAGLPAPVADALSIRTVSALGCGLALSVMPDSIRFRDLLTKPGPRYEAVRFGYFATVLPVITILVLAGALTPFLYFQF